jgi:hypothetical protein
MHHTYACSVFSSNSHVVLEIVCLRNAFSEDSQVGMIVTGKLKELS